MQKLAENFYLLENSPGANVYLLQSSRGLGLVDCGMARKINWINRQLEENGWRLNDLRELILTHAHSDHIGGAPALRQQTELQLTASGAAAPYLEGSSRLPYQKLHQQIFFHLSDLLTGIPPLPVDRKLEPVDYLDYLGGLQVIATPGHTPGSISLYQPESGILICGDAVFNAHPLTGTEGLRFPIPLATVNTQLARDSVQILADLDINLLCPGHGPPIRENIPGQLSALLEN